MSDPDDIFAEVDATELPRYVPQDPEAVRNEQEVRLATAEAMRASQVGRGPTPDELANLREIEAEPPRYPSAAERLDALESKVDRLLELASAIYNKVNA